MKNFDRDRLREILSSDSLRISFFIGSAMIVALGLSYVVALAGF
ncbi:MAG TPA: hypothetical protein VHL99_11610 [Candidatus Binatia bacterium]|jgi:hypothetical protein|nr:hypothetical protein [Candidatus Binatia bacterium]